MANIIQSAKDLIKFDANTTIALDLKISPTDTIEAVSAKATQELGDLIKNGIKPENIAIIGAVSQLGDINAALEGITAGLGASFGGALDAISDIKGYLDDLDEIINNKIEIAGITETAKLPDDIPVSEAIIKKYARAVSALDALGFPQVGFPDTFLPEERPTSPTPISDWKDRTRVTAECAGGVTIKEIPSRFAAEYPKNILVKSNTGHFIEMDDTEGSERINIQHKNGAFITIHQDKSIVIRGQNGIQLITYVDGELFVGGNINITVMGDANISTNGDANIDTVGDVNWKVGGDFNLDVTGDTFMANRGDIKMTARQIRQNAGDPRVLNDVKAKTYKLGS
jgi:hypothetical protein